MTGTHSLRTFAADEWPLYKALRLRALADSPDAFGSTLVREQARPDTAWQAHLDGSQTSHGQVILA